MTFKAGFHVSHIIHGYLLGTERQEKESTGTRMRSTHRTIKTKNEKDEIKKSRESNRQIEHQTVRVVTGRCI